MLLVQINETCQYIHILTIVWHHRPLEENLYLYSLMKTCLKTFSKHHIRERIQKVEVTTSSSVTLKSKREISLPLDFPFTEGLH